MRGKRRERRCEEGADRRIDEGGLRAEGRACRRAVGRRAVQHEVRRRGIGAVEVVGERVRVRPASHGSGEQNDRHHREQPELEHAEQR